MKITRLKYILPVISALLLILAFPRFNLGFMAWLALIPLFWFLMESKPREAFKGGLLFGLTFHLYINYFIIVALYPFVSLPLTLLGYFLVAAFKSLFYGIFCLAASYLKDNFRAIYIVWGIPFLWILMEFSRSLGLLGYTAGSIAFSQAHYPSVLQIASVYGHWGIAFLMIMLQVVIVLIIKNKLSRPQLTVPATTWIIIAMVGLIIPGLFPVEKQSSPENIALIQANIEQEDVLAGPRENLLKYEMLTRKAFQKNDDIDLVVWAETVLSLPIARGEPIVPEVKNLSHELNTPFIYGAVVRENEKQFNSAVLFCPQEETLQQNHKKYLVPVVEYFPMEEQLNQLLNLNLNLARYTRGEGIDLHEYGDTSLACIICFESFFGSYSREFSAASAQHMFILTNVGWLGDTHGVDQHADMAMIRAAEMGIGVTQIANTGITISAEHTGKEILRSGIETEEILFLETDFSHRRTIYTIAGDYFVYASLAGLLILYILNIRKPKK